MRLVPTVLLVLTACFHDRDQSADLGHEGGKPAGEATFSRLLILGIDGASWTEIDPLIAAGQMPNFARLKREGVFGDLMSLDDFSKSAVIWNSIATGVTPDRHGVVDFIQWDERLKTAVPTTSSARRAPAFWEIAERAGLSAGVIGQWATWPATPLSHPRSFMLSDRFLSEKEQRVYPADLFRGVDPRAVFREAGPKDLIGLLAPYFDFEQNRPKEGTPSYVANNLRTVNNFLFEDAIKSKIGLEWIQKYNPDVAFNYVRVVDVCQHFFWPSGSAADWAYPGPLQPARVIDAAYRWVDEILGRHLEALGDDAAVLVVSDHGGAAEPVPLYVTANQATGEKLGLTDGARIEPKWYHQLGVHVRVDGRDPDGAVSQDEYERIRGELESRLLALRTVQGQVALHRVPSSNEDLLFDWNRSELRPDSEILVGGERLRLSDVADVSVRTGTHKREGIIAAIGPPFRSGVRLEDVSLIDVARREGVLAALDRLLGGGAKGATVLDVLPTIAVLLGIPVAEDLDGAPVRDLFDERFLRMQPVRFVASYGSRESVTTSAPKRVDRAALEQLESLGYLQGRAAIHKPD